MIIGLVGHIDINKFFATLALKRRPDLRGKPFGIYNPWRKTPLMAVNELASQCGFDSAMRIEEAKRICQEKKSQKKEKCQRCPGLQLAIEDPVMQIKASVYFFTLLKELNPGIKMEPYGIDEAFLDYSGLTFTQAFIQFRETLQLLNDRIGAEWGLSATACLAPNKWLAKMGTNFMKPGGFMAIPKRDLVKIFYPWPIRKFHGIGKELSQRLNEMEIETIGDLAKTPRANLTACFGLALGNQLFDLSQGKDDSQVIPQRAAKSFGNTIRCDFPHFQHIKGRLRTLASKISKRMQKDNYYGRTVTVSLRFKVNGLRWISASKTLPNPRYFNEGEIIYPIALDLLSQLFNVRNINRVGLRVTNLIRDWSQLRLF